MNRLRKLLEEKNEKFMEQFLKSENYYDALDIVKEFLPDYTVEELKTDLKKIKEHPQDQSLDVGELAGVAGGTLDSHQGDLLDLINKLDKK